MGYLVRPLFVYSATRPCIHVWGATGSGAIAESGKMGGELVSLALASRDPDYAHQRTPGCGTPVGVPRPNRGVPIRSRERTRESWDAQPIAFMENSPHFISIS